MKKYVKSDIQRAFKRAGWGHISDALAIKIAERENDLETLDFEKKLMDYTYSCTTKELCEFDEWLTAEEEKLKVLCNSIHAET